MATPVRLVAFDLDGTLTRGETACEGIARGLGRLERMRELEAAPWAQGRRARQEMAGWYRGRTPEELVAGLASVPLAPGLDAGVRRLQAAGVTVAIVSLTWTFAVAFYAAALGVTDFTGTALGPRGGIRHLWPEDKPRWVLALARRRGIPPQQIAAAGDSDGDVPLLAAVGLPFFVGASPPPGVPGLRHRPGADIDALAREMLGP